MRCDFDSTACSCLDTYVVIALTGVFFMTVNTIMADLSDGSSSEERAANFGTLGAVLGGCFLVGPVSGGFLESSLYTTASFHGAALLILCGMIWSYFQVRESLPAHRAGYTSVSRNADTEQPNNLGVDTSPRQRTLLLLRSALARTSLNPLPKIWRVFTSEALQWLAISEATFGLARSCQNAIFFLYLKQQLDWGAKVCVSFHEHRAHTLRCNCALP